MDQERLWEYVQTWQHACGDFVALARSVAGEQVGAPTDLPGWTVHDVVAHTAHLETVLAGGPEETVEVPEAPHIRGPMSVYTEQGVVARRDRGVVELADEIEAAVAQRYADLRADPPTDGAATPARTPGGAGWDTATLLSNRPLDVWMHEQDIRRAIRRPGGYASPAADHTIGTLSASLPYVVGKRVSPPPGTCVRMDIPEAGITRWATVGDDGRARPDGAGGPDVAITLSPEAFVLLAGGRRTPDRVPAGLDGDQELGRAVLNALAVTP